MALYALVEPGRSFWVSVLPAATVLAAGMTITVAPLTATVLAAVDDRHAGLGSAINNAVARIGGLLAIAVVPAAAGIAVGGKGVDLDSGFSTAMIVAGALSASGGVVAWFTIRRSADVRSITRADLTIPCEPADCVRLNNEPASIEHT
jgi:hypothetical protein